MVNTYFLFYGKNIIYFICTLFPKLTRTFKPQNMAKELENHCELQTFQQTKTDVF